MIHKSRFLILLVISFYGFGSPASAKSCKTKSAAADYKCTISNSKNKNKVNIKYRYLKSKRRSVSLDYLKEKKGPYQRESFLVKIDPAKPKEKGSWKNCLFFGLFGKCIRKKIKICDSVLQASYSETYGLFNKYTYKVDMSFDMNSKRGSYTYYRKTPKAVEQDRFQSYLVEFDKCKLIKKY